MIIFIFFFGFFFSGTLQAEVPDQLCFRRELLRGATPENLFRRLRELHGGEYNLTASQHIEWQRGIQVEGARGSYFSPLAGPQEKSRGVEFLNQQGFHAYDPGRGWVALGLEKQAVENEILQVNTVINGVYNPLTRDIQKKPSKVLLQSDGKSVVTIPYFGVFNPLRKEIEWEEAEVVGNKVYGWSGVFDSLEGEVNWMRFGLKESRNPLDDYYHYGRPVVRKFNLETGEIEEVDWSR